MRTRRIYRYGSLGAFGPPPLAALPAIQLGQAKANLQAILDALNSRPSSEDDMVMIPSHQSIHRTPPQEDEGNLIFPSLVRITEAQEADTNGPGGPGCKGAGFGCPANVVLVWPQDIISPFQDAWEAASAIAGTPIPLKFPFGTSPGRNVNEVISGFTLSSARGQVGLLLNAINAKINQSPVPIPDVPPQVPIVSAGFDGVFVLFGAAALLGLWWYFGDRKPASRKRRSTRRRR